MRDCPRCLKRRRVLEVQKIDPKTMKKWMVSQCGICQYGFDLVEAEKREPDPNPPTQKLKRYNWPSGYKRDL